MCFCNQPTNCVDSLLTQQARFYSYFSMQTTGRESVRKCGREVGHHVGRKLLISWLLSSVNESQNLTVANNTPYPSPLTAHPLLLTLYPSLITPHPSPLAPHSSSLTPRSLLLTPYPSLLTPHPSPLTPYCCCCCRPTPPWLLGGVRFCCLMGVRRQLLPPVF